MLLHLESINAWSTLDADKANPTDDNKTNTPAWPKLEFVPAMQRRRLSPFAKIALYTAENALSALSALSILSTFSTFSETVKSETAKPEIPEQAAQIDIVFSSRHGDLHKTAELLTELTADQDISPTAFSTSVHNAVPGLYSIIKQNKQAINAISAGKDSFFYALLDAYARLKSGRSNKLLIIHVDRVLPELYSQFADEQQVDHAVAMVVTSAITPATIASIEMNFNACTGIEKGNAEEDNTELKLPAAVCFMHWFDATADVALPALQYSSDRHTWTCELITGMADV